MLEDKNMYTSYVLKYRTMPHSHNLMHFRGNSTYEKPTKLTHPRMASGSELYEYDTQLAYMYDRDSDSWIEQ